MSRVTINAHRCKQSTFTTASQGLFRDQSLVYMLRRKHAGTHLGSATLFPPLRDIVKVTDFLSLRVQE